VIPVYNEEDNLPSLYQRLEPILNQLDATSELILIDDGSKDNSLHCIGNLRKQDSRVKYISLARNFGHQIAVTAGLNFAKGQAIIIMDADLQDPPELLPQMIEIWRSGYQVVYAQRVARKRESWFKRICAYLYYRVIKRLADVDIPNDTGDFCLLDKQVVDILNTMPERNRYIRGLRAWVGFKQTSLPFIREARFAGSVKYTFIKSFTLAINGIIAMSKVPLRLSTYLGLFSATCAILMIFLVFYWRFFAPSEKLVGYTLITSAIFFLGAVQLICLGILGEYVGRIYDEVKCRPLYTIKKIEL